ncbi:hypothetical protein L0P10_18840, partial [Eggerthella lenta]|nr:hypothetical protein [Eggerthella lenta]
MLRRQSFKGRVRWEIDSKKTVPKQSLFGVQCEKRMERRCKTMSKVHVFDHPLIQHKMTIMRKVETGTKQFR